MTGLDQLIVLSGERSGRRVALEGGEFAWTKRLKRDVPVGLLAEVDGLRSNRIRLR